MAVKWLSRRIGPPGPYLTLCLTESEYREAFRHLKTTITADWVSCGANATTHYASNDKGETVCIICMRDWEHRTLTEIIGLLVHEAVHVWQIYIDNLGENDPGREQEAYGIQYISQTLIERFINYIGSIK